MSHPDNDDVVIRQKHGNPSTVYLLGTPAAPDQFMIRTRDEAVSKALVFARRQHVRAWFANGHEDFVLLGTFREERVSPSNPRFGEWQERRQARDPRRLLTAHRSRRVG